MAEANFAVVFVPLGTAGQIGRPSGHGQRAGRPSDGPCAGLRRAGRAGRGRGGRRCPTWARPPWPATTRSPAAGSTGTPRTTRASSAMFAILMLAGATFAAFNLTTRIVESQRRQVGIGLALGLPARDSRHPAARRGRRRSPCWAWLLGIGVGLLFGLAMREVLDIHAADAGLRDALPARGLRPGRGRRLRAAVRGFDLPGLARRSSSPGRRDPDRLSRRPGPGSRPPGPPAAASDPGPPPAQQRPADAAPDDCSLASASVRPLPSSSASSG